MIPTFPKFKKLSLEDNKEITYFIKEFPPYSDFNFVSLWSYDTKNEVEVSFLNGNLVVKFTDYINSEPFYSFLGNNDVEPTIESLLDLSKKNKIEPILKMIPETVILSDPNLKVKFSIKEDRDNFDYILSIPKVSKLEGNRYEHKRWRFNQFHKHNNGYRVSKINLRDKNMQSKLIDLFLRWETNQSNKNKEMELEFIAFLRLLKNADKFDLVSIGIFKENKLIAFSINEIVHDNFAQGQFAKFDSSYKGIFESMHKFTAMELFKSDCLFFNLEQDLGVSSLREAKESWHPINFLKKYKIYP